MQLFITDGKRLKYTELLQYCKERDWQAELSPVKSVAEDSLLSLSGDSSLHWELAARVGRKPSGISGIKLRGNHAGYGTSKMTKVGSLVGREAVIDQHCRPTSLRV